MEPTAEIGSRRNHPRPERGERAGWRQDVVLIDDFNRTLERALRCGLQRLDAIPPPAVEPSKCWEQGLWRRAHSVMGTRREIKPTPSLGSSSSVSPPAT